MHYIILDLEWNQALSKDAIRNKGFPLIGEIIQIGAVRMDPNGSVLDTIRLTVAPKYYKKMHWSVKKLTGITTETLENGLLFPDAYEQFCAWCGEDVVFLTWGPDDIPMLRTNLRLHKMDHEKLPAHYDLQKIFFRTISSEKQQWSLSDALAHLGITDVYPPHDALNDSLNTAKICPHMPLEHAIAHYDDPVPRRAVFTTPPPGESLAYESYDDMARQNRGIRAACPECGEEVRFGKWVRRAPGKRIAMGVCICGESCIMKLRWKEDEDTGAIAAYRSLDLASDEQKAAYRRAAKKKHRSRKKTSAPSGEQTYDTIQPV